MISRKIPVHLRNTEKSIEQKQKSDTKEKSQPFVMNNLSMIMKFSRNIILILLFLPKKGFKALRKNPFQGNYKTKEYCKIDI